MNASLVEQKGIEEFTELEQFNPDSETLSKLDVEFCIENSLALLKNPDRENRYAVVGMLEPDNKELLKKLEHRLKSKVKAVQLNEYEIGKLLSPKAISPADDAQSQCVRLSDKNEISFEAEQSPANILDDALASAIRLRASDMHIENFEDDVDLRMRIDGVMHQITTPLSPENVKPVSGRLKVLAGMDLAERRMPQDGRVRALYKDKDGVRKIDMRVSTMPSMFGENIVIRFLDPKTAQFGISEIGIDEIRMQKLEKVLALRQGIVFVTGPTGAGKSTTLYSFMRKLASPELKILTVEDPIEYRLPKVCQHQVSEKMPFASYTKAFLRHDPDIIMIGEIRDEITASLAVRAAMTGHLVLSTMHTNNAVSAIERLRDLGVSDNYIADVLKAVIAQRLVRKICPACGGDDTPQDYTSSFLNGACSECDGIGFKGRTGIFELFIPDENISRMIADGRNVSEIRNALPKDHISLEDDGKIQVAAGITKFSELHI